MRKARRLRSSWLDSLKLKSGLPSSHSMVSSRRVHSSGTSLGTWMCGLAAQHLGVEAEVPRLLLVVELLAQPGRDLLVDQAGVDRGIPAAVQAEDQPELREVGVDRGLHVRVLQLAGDRAAVVQHDLVHLAQRRRGRRLQRELGEALGPVRPELRHHAPADERLAHRRRVALQLGELGRVLGGQGVGDGGDELRHLHQRPLQAAQRLLQLGGVASRRVGRPIRRAPAIRAACTPTVPPTWA